MALVEKKLKDCSLLKDRPYILVSNDDGPNYFGLKVLLNALKCFADVVAVIPDGKRSGSSMSITNNHIKLKELCDFEIEGVKVYICSGTPTDCIKLALSNVVTKKPDLIISGINKGCNLSLTSLNSGTVAVGIEAASKNYCGICLSYEGEVECENKDILEEIVLFIVSHVYANKSEYTGIALNVNIPINLHNKINKDLFRECHSAYGFWEKEWTLYKEQDGIKEFKRTGHMISTKEENSDTWAIEHGYISVVKFRPCFREN